MGQKADLREAMLSKTKPGRGRTPASFSKEAEPVATAPSDDGYVQPSRAGKKPIAGFFPPDVRKQLKLMTVEQDTTLQDLMAEAFNDLFAKYGKPEIAPTREHA